MKKIYLALFVSVCSITATYAQDVQNSNSDVTLEQLDKDGDGQLSLEEFDPRVIDAPGKADKQQIFNFIDTDKNGYVSKEEINTIIEKLKPSK